MWNKLLEQCHWRRFGTFICNIEQISHIILVFKKLLNFMAPFYGWGSTASRLQPLRGGSLLFIIQFPEIPGTHLIDLGRMKGWVDLGATQWFIVDFERPNAGWNYSECYSEYAQS